HYPVNIGNPDEFTLLELAETVIEVTESRSEIIYEALPTDDPKQRRPDITRAQELLDWSPEVSLREGLKLTIEQAGTDTLTGAARQADLPRGLQPDEGPRVVRVPRHGAAVRPQRAVRQPRRAARADAHRLLPHRGDGRRPDLRDRQRRAVLELLHLLWVAALRRRLCRDVPLPLRGG